MLLHRATAAAASRHYAVRCRCTAAEVTAAVLRSGEAGPSLAELKALTAAMPPQPVTLAMLQGSSRDRSQRTRILNAQFLQRELTARRAHVLSLVKSMPSPLAEQPAVARLAQVYWERLHVLLSLPPISTEADERAFASRMFEQNELIQVQTPEEFKMCVDALGVCKRGGVAPEQQLAVDRQLDAIFIARIGMRFLLEHYVASERAADPDAQHEPTTPRSSLWPIDTTVSESPAVHANAATEGFAGIIQKRCSPVALCRALGVEIRERLQADYGRAPPIEVVGNADETFVFVPSHLGFVIGTLLKNSCVATLRHHHRKQAADDVPLPPVRVIIAMSDTLVQAGQAPLVPEGCTH